MIRWGSGKMYKAAPTPCSPFLGGDKFLEKEQQKSERPSLLELSPLRYRPQLPLNHSEKPELEMKGREPSGHMRREERWRGLEEKLKHSSRVRQVGNLKDSVQVHRNQVEFLRVLFLGRVTGHDVGSIPFLLFVPAFRVLP